MNNKKTFCIISIDGNFNKFSLNFPKLNSCFCFSINSHEVFIEAELRDKVKDYSNIIIVCALAGSCANKILLSTLNVLKDKNCLVVANTPFDFEGKKRRKLAQDMLDILEIKKVNKIVFYSRNFLEKYRNKEMVCTRDIFNLIDLEIVETINKIIKANSYY